MTLKSSLTIVALAVTGVSQTAAPKFVEGANGARDNQKLTVAAAGHGGLQGDIEYPQQKGLRGPNDEMRWWDYWLKGIDTGIMDEPPRLNGSALDYEHWPIVRWTIFRIGGRFAKGRTETRVAAADAGFQNSDGDRLAIT